MELWVLAVAPAGMDDELEMVCLFKEKPDEGQIRAALADHQVKMGMPITEAGDVDMYFDTPNGARMVIEKLEVR